MWQLSREVNKGSFQSITGQSDFLVGQWEDEEFLELLRGMPY